jgi:alpha-methylacyl-CoA racemase
MGPLDGYRVVEMGGIGPGPMCAMLLADMGADVVRIERPGGDALGLQTPARYNLLLRGRRRIGLDMRRAGERAMALSLIERADALIEGFRPGAMERLGLGPDVCLARNPRLVYGRMTGWGQEGPFARAAGHDLNYIALTGALAAIGRAGGPPVPPLNLVGDFGGGALYLAFGIVCALIEARKSGRGQVVDAAMVDGAASLMTIFYGLVAAGALSPERGDNVLDSGAPYYDVYRCADGQWLAVAAIEMPFRLKLFELLGLEAADAHATSDRAHWPRVRKLMVERIAERTRAQWCQVLEGSDACAAPVLSLSEAPDHPHNRSRGTFVEIGGIVQPAPAPRFSRSVPDRPLPPSEALCEPESVLSSWGGADEEGPS